MQRAAVVVVIGLLVLNTALVGWLILGSGPASHRDAASVGIITESQLAQLDKLSKIMADFHQELVTVTGQATYQDDKEKTSGKEILQAETLSFGLSRLDYSIARKTGNVRDVQTFLVGAVLGHGMGWATMSAPNFQRYVSPKWENGRQVKDGGYETYANISRLESLEEQFKVLSISLLEDIK